MKRPRGVLVPLTTPFDPATGDVAPVALRDNARAMLAAGVAGYTAVTVAAQTWITPIVFTRVGLGLGAASIVSKVANTFEPGPAVSVTVGGELGHRKRSGIDLSIRLSGGPVDSSQIGESIFYSLAAMISYHRN